MLSSFKGRIVTIIILLLGLSLSVSTFLSNRQLSSSISSSVDKYSMLQVSSTSDKINTWLNGVSDVLVASAPHFSNDLGEEEINLTINTLAVSTQASMILVGYEDGPSTNALR